MEEVSVFHQRLNDEGSDIYILIGGLNSNNPVELLNNYVSRIVGYSSYSEFTSKTVGTLILIQIQPHIMHLLRKS